MCKLKLNDTTLDPPTTTNIFKTLISALESHQGIKSRLLKSTYNLFIRLSSNQQPCLGKGAHLNELFMKTNDGEVRVSLRDLYTLSSILFKDLQRRLKKLQSSNHDVSATRSLELEELNLLIRCCMVTLTFHLPQKHFLESGRVLLLIFKKLSLFQVAGASDRSLSCECMNIGENCSDNFANVASFCIPSIMAILEVVVDELLVNGRVRKYLQIIPSFFPRSERLFKHGGEFGVTMEMLYSHFSLSISDEGCLEEFLNKVTLAHSSISKPLELSITAGRMLLQNPVVLSSPKLLQAHIISLVSSDMEVKYNKRLASHPRLIDNCLAVFESSVILYTRHMSILKTEHARGNLVISQTCFESCIDPAKKQKLDETIATLNNSWNLNLRGKLFKTKSDLLASSIEYISQIAPSISCQDEVLCFLKCMVTRAANDDNNMELPINSLEDICMLASLLMLMSNSLIQSVWCVRRSMEHDFIVGIIRCFKDFSIRLPIQKFCYNIMESCNEPRVMLIHFLGLLSLSFDSGLEVLVKSCTSVIMGLINLFVFEEGNIDGLRSLAQERSLVIYKQPLVWRGVVANFHKKRTLYLSNGCEEGEESCSGEIYLKSRNVKDLEELGDFVECKKGKDYVSWLKDRDRFRKSQISKRAKRMWDKKRLAWRSVTRNKS